ncbi:MAG: hypothetical protein ACRCST_08955 [Turicibacter sp.]
MSELSKQINVELQKLSNGELERERVKAEIKAKKLEFQRELGLLEAELSHYSFDNHKIVELIEKEIHDMELFRENFRKVDLTVHCDDKGERILVYFEDYDKIKTAISLVRIEGGLDQYCIRRNGLEYGDDHFTLEELDLICEYMFKIITDLLNALNGVK